MKKTHYDPILTEMHAIKDAISAEFNHDIDALFDHLREVEAKAVAAGEMVVNTPRRATKRPRLETLKRRQKIGVKVATSR